VKDTEYFFTHIHWLQERFPEAQYENVTGFCKLATMDEVKEQEYSLNPGRYVGVVIEEDGKIEEEFTAEIVELNDELDALNIDIYEEAILSETPLRDRQGNWVQKYKSNEDALLFTTAQFSRFQEVEAFIKENLSNPARFAKPSKTKGAE